MAADLTSGLAAGSTTWSFLAALATKQTNANRRALDREGKRPRRANIQLEMSVPPLMVFFYCEGFSVPFSIAKPTLGGTATLCRCPKTHKKSEPLAQPLTQPTAHATYGSRNHLTQPPHAAKGLTQPLLVLEVGCWSNPLTGPRFGGIPAICLHVSVIIGSPSLVGLGSMICRGCGGIGSRICRGCGGIGSRIWGGCDGIGAGGA